LRGSQAQKTYQAGSSTKKKERRNSWGVGTLAESLPRNPFGRRGGIEDPK